MTAERITTLFTRYMEGNVTEAERLELSALTLMAENTPLLKSLEQEYWEKMEGSEEVVTEEEVKKLLYSIGVSKPAIIKSLFWRRIAVAASITIVLALGSYFLFFNKSSKQDEIVKTEPAKDVKAPETNRAMITLADGRTVYLDSAMNGQLAVQGNIKLVKLANGQIAYQTASGEIIKELKYNTLNNPRGSKVIDMTLADGSRVWLNAGSSVTFPVAFIGNERKVSITGEAYFEVAHNTSMPFKVSKGEMEVTVLGTHFNVNAYDDENDIKVTLLEGSVKVNKGDENKLLKPGQQARITSDIKVVSGVDIDEVMAWKNGRFQFEGAGIEEVMRQVARWYDVEVIYETKPMNQHFRGGISREVEASKLFKMLESTEAIHFRIEGKKVFVIK